MSTEKREEKKLRRTDRQLFIILFAMADLIKSYDEYYHTFLSDRTKTGYRDLKAAEAFFNKAISQIMDTILLFAWVYLGGGCTIISTGCRAGAVHCRI